MDNTKIDDFNVYLHGAKLYGDDFSQEQIDAWFHDEKDGYFELTQSDDEKNSYGYHALNLRHGFSHLPIKKYGHVLGIGSAYGRELGPIFGCTDKISILEPSDGFVSTEIEGVPLNYVKPVANGHMPFESESVDLITCFGVLHHIPNVSTVIREFHRVLKPGGYALVREPIISMGDWRLPRRGLTKHERGIPLPLLSQFIQKAGLVTLKESKCVFSLTSRLKPFITGSVYNNHLIVALDALICSLPVWPTTYHASNVLQKFRAMSVFYVLSKPFHGPGK
jgi:SAM-dependent methyltransferase